MLNPVALSIVGLTLLVSGCGGGDSGSSAPPSQPPSAPPAASGLSFSPSSGPIGTLVLITGGDLSTAHSATIGGTETITMNPSATSLQALVMPGSSSGPVSVTTANGNLTSAGSFTITAAGMPRTQQGTRIPLFAASNFGTNQIAVSADGNTVLVGAADEGLGNGAVWVLARNNGALTSQGPKLIGTDTVRGILPVHLGLSVALSADGNTALAGGPGDNMEMGAVWVFIRANGVWTQQGPKLAAVEPNTGLGFSVALSADGNTAISGIPIDNLYTGGALVFTRTAGVWTQQRQKLVGTGNAGAAQQGVAVALSADGATVAIGGPVDDGAAGAVWVFTRSNGAWTQQGPKLVGRGRAGLAQFGARVTLSADGNTLLVGGHADNRNTGAVWVFTRANGVWRQQSLKLVATDIVNTPNFPTGFGFSAALNADGNTALVGAPQDNARAGAAWLFTRTGDAWTQEGSKLPATASEPLNFGTALAMTLDGTTA